MADRGGPLARLCAECTYWEDAEECDMALWWLGNALGLLVVIPLVLFLAAQVLRVSLEIARYADDIAEHGVGLTGALDPLPALADTVALTGRVRTSAVRYLQALERLS